MGITITPTASIAMFGAMLVLAAVPDASAFAVIARAVASGFAHGVVTVIGIIAGDAIFILLALLGLSAIADTMSGLFDLVRYAAGGYLVWIGVGLFRLQSKPVNIERVIEPSWLSNFLCGLLITLGDPKAILFYISFLPAFLDMSSATVVDAGIVIGLAALSIGITKLGYAYMAVRAGSFFHRGRARRVINLAAGSVLMGTGLFLIVGS